MVCPATQKDVLYSPGSTYAKRCAIPMGIFVYDGAVAQFGVIRIRNTTAQYLLQRLRKVQPVIRGLDG